MQLFKGDGAAGMSAIFDSLMTGSGDEPDSLYGLVAFDRENGISAEAAKSAARVGVHGVMAVTPYYNRPPQEGLVRHFHAIADATDLPLGVYNNPPRVKTDLHWDNLLRIFKHPNYVVHKESTTRVGQVAQVLLVAVAQPAFVLDHAEPRPGDRPHRPAPGRDGHLAGDGRVGGRRGAGSRRGRPCARGRVRARCDRSGPWRR